MQDFQKQPDPIAIAHSLSSKAEPIDRALLIPMRNAVIISVRDAVDEPVRHDVPMIAIVFQGMRLLEEVLGELIRVYRVIIIDF